MYVCGMHLQYNYNYDIERVKRFVIHYATPDGKVIPFCAYNTGPNFREEIEKKFAVPIEEWRGRQARGGGFALSVRPPEREKRGRPQSLPSLRGLRPAAAPRPRLPLQRG